MKKTILLIQFLFIGFLNAGLAQSLFDLPNVDTLLESGNRYQCVTRKGKSSIKIFLPNKQLQVVAEGLIQNNAFAVTTRLMAYYENGRVLGEYLPKQNTLNVYSKNGDLHEKYFFEKGDSTYIQQKFYTKNRIWQETRAYYSDAKMVYLNSSSFRKRVQYKLTLKTLNYEALDVTDFIALFSSAYNGTNITEKEYFPNGQVQTEKDCKKEKLSYYYIPNSIIHYDSTGRRIPENEYVTRSKEKGNTALQYLERKFEYTVAGELRMARFTINNAQLYYTAGFDDNKMTNIAIGSLSPPLVVIDTSSFDTPRGRNSSLYPIISYNFKQKTAKGERDERRESTFFWHKTVDKSGELYSFKLLNTLIWEKTLCPPKPAPKIIATYNERQVLEGDVRIEWTENDSLPYYTAFKARFMNGLPDGLVEYLDRKGGVLMSLVYKEGVFIKDNFSAARERYLLKNKKPLPSINDTIFYKKYDFLSSKPIKTGFSILKPFKIQGNDTLLNEKRYTMQGELALNTYFRLAKKRNPNNLLEGRTFDSTMTAYYPNGRLAERIDTRKNILTTYQNTEQRLLSDSTVLNADFTLQKHWHYYTNGKLHTYEETKYALKAAFFYRIKGDVSENDRIEALQKTLISSENRSGIVAQKEVIYNPQGDEICTEINDISDKKQYILKNAAGQRDTSCSIFTNKYYKEESRYSDKGKLLFYTLQDQAGNYLKMMQYDSDGNLSAKGEKDSIWTFGKTSYSIAKVKKLRNLETGRSNNTISSQTFDNKTKQLLEEKTIEKDTSVYKTFGKNQKLSVLEKEHNTISNRKTWDKNGKPLTVALYYKSSEFSGLNFKIFPILDYSAHDTLEKQGCGYWLNHNKMVQPQHDEFIVLQNYYPSGRLKADWVQIGDEEFIKADFKDANINDNCYTENALPIYKGVFKNGARDGLWEAFTDKGDKIYRLNYANGFLEGEITLYGAQTQVKGQMKHGVPDGVWTTIAAAQPLDTMTTTWSMGEQISSKTIKTDTNEDKITHTAQPYRTLTETVYLPIFSKKTTNLIDKYVENEEFTLVNGKRQHKIYYKNKQLKEQYYTLEKGSADSLYTKWDENGKVIASEYYDDDIKVLLPQKNTAKNLKRTNNIVTIPNTKLNTVFEKEWQTLVQPCKIGAATTKQMEFDTQAINDSIGIYSIFKLKNFVFKDQANQNFVFYNKKPLLLGALSFKTSKTFLDLPQNMASINSFVFNTLSESEPNTGTDDYENGGDESYEPHIGFENLNISEVVKKHYTNAPKPHLMHLKDAYTSINLAQYPLLNYCDIQTKTSVSSAIPSVEVSFSHLFVHNFNEKHTTILETFVGFLNSSPALAVGKNTGIVIVPKSLILISDLNKFKLPFHQIYEIDCRNEYQIKAEDEFLSQRKGTKTVLTSGSFKIENIKKEGVIKYIYLDKTEINGAIIVKNADKTAFINYLQSKNIEVMDEYTLFHKTPSIEDTDVILYFRMK
jgi:antitoxin component YwqK of YwqJK toxin-antitoxin module